MYIYEAADKELLSGVTLCFVLPPPFFPFFLQRATRSGKEKLSEVRGQGLAGSVRGSLHAILQAHY